MVVNALSHKTASFSIGGICKRISIDLSLLGMIREVKLRESRKRTRSRSDSKVILISFLPTVMDY